MSKGNLNVFSSTIKPSPNKYKKPLSSFLHFWHFLLLWAALWKNGALFWIQGFSVVVLFYFQNFSVSIISQPQQISFLTREGKVMPNKLTLTCSSVGAVGGFQLPHLVTSHSKLPEVLLTYTDPTTCTVWLLCVSYCCCLMLSVVTTVVVCCCVAVSSCAPLPGFRCLARLFSGPRTASAARLYLRPPGPRVSCVKRFPLTSPNWVSFIRFFCTQTQFPIPPSLFDRTN